MAERMRRAVAAALLALALLGPGGGAGAVEAWGWLGVRIRDLSEQEMNEISTRHGIAEGFGAMIVEVLKDTPAETSGLRTGDLVVAFRDRPVVDTRSLVRLIGASGVGATVSLTILRRDEGRRQISAQLAAMPSAVAADRIAGELGFVVREPEAQPELGGGAAEPVPHGVGRPAGQPRRGGGDAGGRRPGGGRRQGGAHVPGIPRRAARLDGDRPLSLVVRRDGQRVAVMVPVTRNP